MTLWEYLDLRGQRRMDLKLQVLGMPTIDKAKTDAFRNFLAFSLIGTFVGCLPLLIFKGMPENSKEVITYIIGQLSGMATTCLAFYFTQKVGQDALDSKRADNTKVLAELAGKALDAGGGASPPGAVAEKAAEEVAGAAVDKAGEFKADA
jgi:hypothetical protein